jgi:hypothetical protein
MQSGRPATINVNQKASRPDPENHADLSGLISLRELVKQIPTAGRGSSPHIASAIRWCTTGVRARDGSRIRLKAYKTPGGWMSSQSWAVEFFEKMTADRVAAADSPTDTPLPVSPAQRRREIARAGRVLDDAGIV